MVAKTKNLTEELKEIRAESNAMLTRLERLYRKELEIAGLLYENGKISEKMYKKAKDDYPVKVAYGVGIDDFTK